MHHDQRVKHILFLLLLVPAFAQASVTLRVAETDPTASAALGHWEPYYVRASYTADRPIRVRGDAYFQGKRVTSMTSGSPVHGAGSGDAMFWFAYTTLVQVDRIVMYAEDDRTRASLAQVELPVELTWTGQQPATARPRAAWVDRMRAEQDARAKAERAAYRNQPTPWWETAVFLAASWSVPLYFIVQILALVRLRGGWRIAAAVPAAPMLLLLAHAVFAFFAGSNLFPLLLIFTCAPALIYLLILLALSRRASVSAAA